MGTARPAHYFVLLNEIFTEQFIHPRTNISDYLHKLTYEMCYLFGRSTGPVSIPPPVFYADLACERSRCYGDFDDDDISDTSSMTGDNRGGPPAGQGGTQLPYRPHPGSGSQASNKPRPSNSNRGAQGTPACSKNTMIGKGGPGSTSSAKKGDGLRKAQQATESRPINQGGRLSKKERERVWKENIASARQTAAGSLAEAEEKTADDKGKGKAIETGAETEDKTEGKGKGKAEDKEPEPSIEEQKKEKETEEKKKKKKVKEKDKVEIHERLRDTMFYV